MSRQFNGVNASLGSASVDMVEINPRGAGVVVDVHVDVSFGSASPGTAKSGLDSVDECVEVNVSNDLGLNVGFEQVSLRWVS